MLTAAFVALVLAAEGLSKDAIKQVVMQHHDEMKLCYEKQLQKDPSLAGKVAVQFTIGSSGRVSDVSADEDTLGNPAVVACMLKRVKAWKFPQPAGGGDVTVTFPFVFSAPEEEPLPEVEPEPMPEPPPRDPAEDKRLAEEMWREHEANELANPPGIAELWNMGGAGMYPVALGLLVGLGAGGLALVLALSRAKRMAVVVAGLALGAGAAGFSAGWLGYVNGMIGSYSAVAHVNPADKEIILRYATREASVCWKFGSLTLGASAVLAAAALAAALKKSEAPRE